LLHAFVDVCNWPFCCRTSLRGDANRDSVDLRRPSAERFDDGAAQG
jgi:hypothetical protein